MGSPNVMNARCGCLTHSVHVHLSLKFIHILYKQWQTQETSRLTLYIYKHTLSRFSLCFNMKNQNSFTIRCVAITYRRNRREGRSPRSHEVHIDSCCLLNTSKNTLLANQKKRFHSLMKQISLTILAMNTEALLEALTPKIEEKKLLKLLSDLSS